MILYDKMYSKRITKFTKMYAKSDTSRLKEHGKKKCFTLDETLECIFSHLTESKDRASASQVCKHWYRIEGSTRKYVSVPNCYAIAPRALSRRFPNLEGCKVKGKPRAVEFGLLVENWGGHADQWVTEIVRAYPRLQLLHFRRMSVTDDDLEAIAAGLGAALQVLKLDKCSGRLSTRGLEHIAQRCRSLKTLYLEETEIENKGPEWLLYLGDNVPCLEGLNLASTGLEVNVNDALVTLVQKCRQLTSLKVGEIELERFREIMRHSTSSFRELGTGCYSFEGDNTLITSFFPWVSNLKVLDLKFMPLGMEGHCQLLSRCTALEDLQVRSTLGDSGLEVVGRVCQRLRRIRVDNQDDQDDPGFIGHRGLTAIAEGCRDIQFLVMYLQNVTNESLAAVGRYSTNLKDFRIVLLSTSEPTDLPLDNGVRSLLQGCAKVTRFSVYLRPGGISDKGLAHIGQFGGNLKWILLGCSGESDLGLYHLASGCQNLKRMELRGCPFDDDQLANTMRSMPSLRYLWVEGVGATRRLAQLLVQSIPYLHVDWIASAEQLCAYYSLTSPRTDIPDTVEIFSNKTRFYDEPGLDCCSGLEGSAFYEGSVYDGAC